MGIAYSDVKYYKSVDIDFTDDTANGGDIGAQIVNDTLHSIFPEVSATQREDGITHRAKVFVKNTSGDRKMQDAIFYIKQDVQPADRLVMYTATTQVNHENDEDFGTLKKLVNSVVKSTVVEGSTTVAIPAQDKPLFEVGDPLVIVDQYFRAVYRGEVNAIDDDGNDATNAIITLSSAFASSVSIPTLEGFICNGFKGDLAPDGVHSMWLELTIASTSAIDAEIVNQFQIGVHFDDVTA